MDIKESLKYRVYSHYSNTSIPRDEILEPKEDKLDIEPKTYNKKKNNHNTNMGNLRRFFYNIKVKL